jgi:hypothetical protein
VARILTVLSIASAALLAATFVVGWSLGDYRDAHNRYANLLGEQRRLASAVVVDQPRVDQLQTELDSLDPTILLATMHRTMGVVTALVVLLVNSIAVTYFVGTSRWCKEVVETYNLPPELALRSAALKRRTFPWTTLAMATIILVAALGAAGDPMSSFGRTHDWSTFHLASALLGGMLIVYVHFIQWNNVSANHRVIEAIMEQVRQAREARGLEIE